MEKSEGYKELINYALKGDAYAQYRLGATLFTGYFEGYATPVEKDNEAGVYWYCQAAKQGYAVAVYNLGVCLILGGDGLEKDEKSGLRLITMAAEVNHSSACHFLEMCFENGLYGQAVDMRLAAHWRKCFDEYEGEEEYCQPVDIEQELGIKLKAPALVVESE